MIIYHTAGFPLFSNTLKVKYRIYLPLFFTLALAGFKSIYYLNFFKPEIKIVFSLLTKSYLRCNSRNDFLVPSVDESWRKHRVRSNWRNLLSTLKSRNRFSSNNAFLGLWRDRPVPINQSKN